MDIVELTKNNMLDYSGAVNQSRAIPDARTGLKPIHRKIIYEMYADKIFSTNKYKKCAYMVGQIIARFSEHGDAATYDALIRLSQPWIQRYPLIDLHGNGGTQFGDPSAAMRYVEARLDGLTELGFLRGLSKQNVDWIPNFTNEELEPATLPAVFPGLFCLPNQGIGYACACNFLTYNLKDVANLIDNYIRTNNIDTIHYDLASGGVFVNPKVMDSIYKTGKGTVIIESNYYIEGKTIHINELPFNVMFDDVVEDIIKLCESDEITSVSNVYNNSGNNKLDLVIEVNRGYDPEKVINELFDKTKLRSSYGINQIALVNGQPKRLTMKDMLDIYIEHNTTCIRREHEHDYKETIERIEILEGLLKALSDIEDIIDAIKNSSSPADAKTLLQQKWSFTDNQVQAILDMKLSRLSGLEQEKLEKEYAEKKKFAQYCEQIINSSDKQKEILLERLQELVAKFGDKRRTKVIQKEIVKASKSKSKKEQLPEDVVVAIDDNGYLKSIPLNSFKTNSEHLNEFKTTTADMVLLFSNYGKLYRVRVSAIKQCGSKDKGSAAGSIVKLDQGEKILNVFSMNVDEKHPYMVFFTKNGLVKKSEKKIYISNTQNLNGLTVCSLGEDNCIVGVYESNGDIALVSSNNNMTIFFELEKVNCTGKTSKGVKAIALQDGDYVTKAKVVTLAKWKEIQTKNAAQGVALKLQNRGGKGIRGCRSNL